MNKKNKIYQTKKSYTKKILGTYSFSPDLTFAFAKCSSDSRSFSPDIFSRSTLFGSGRRSTVSTNPKVDKPASIRNRPDSPIDEPSIITLRNVPINAPVFPPAADAPDPIPLTFVGNTSGGYTNVVTFG